MAHTVKSLAEHWRCSRRHVYNLIDTGQLKAFSIGTRGKRISDEEVERWEKSEREATPTETLPSDVLRDIGLPTSII